jgi:hypothetical protein
MVSGGSGTTITGGIHLEKVFDLNMAQPGRRDLYFAAEYDRDQTFYVNNLLDVKSWFKSHLAVSS